LCHAQAGYDGPTGLGTPNGVAGFQPPANDFAFGIDPGHGSVPDEGGMITASVDSTVIKGGAERISYIARSSSGELTVSVSPSTVDAGSPATLTVTTDISTPPGVYAVEVIARGVQATHTASYKVRVRPRSRPHIEISVTPGSIPLGQSATLAWSSTEGPNNCFASGAWSGPQPDAGTLMVSPAFTGNHSYRLECDNEVGFSQKRAVLTVTPQPPVVTITVNPARIGAGQSAQLSWEATHARTCLASDSWTGSKATTGQETVMPTGSSTFRYTLTCTGSGGTTSSSAVLAVQAVSQ
jgi:hypothetical protein